MSAELLRRAADKLREAAGAATGAPWTSDAGRVRSASAAPGMPVVRDKEPALSICRKVADADYSSLMHPPVALALAEWLESEAQLYASNIAAFVVALAVLREDGAR